jgi:hypothetical protein
LLAAEARMGVDGEDLTAGGVCRSRERGQSSCGF